MLAALCLGSCKTTRQLVIPARVDSLRASSAIIIKQTSAVEPPRLEPPSELSITSAQIDSLPSGAEFSTGTDQARASLRKQPDGSLTLSAQGIVPAKVTTDTRMEAESEATADDYKPPEVRSDNDKKAFEWWPDGMIIGSIVFAVLSICCLLWATRK